MGAQVSKEQQEKNIIHYDELSDEFTILIDISAVYERLIFLFEQSKTNSTITKEELIKCITDFSKMFNIRYTIIKKLYTDKQFISYIEKINEEFNKIINESLELLKLDKPIDEVLKSITRIEELQKKYRFYITYFKFDELKQKIRERDISTIDDEAIKLLTSALVYRKKVIDVFDKYKSDVNHESFDRLKEWFYIYSNLLKKRIEIIKNTLTPKQLYDVLSYEMFCNLIDKMYGFYSGGSEKLSDAIKLIDQYIDQLNKLKCDNKDEIDKIEDYYHNGTIKEFETYKQIIKKIDLTDVNSINDNLIIIMDCFLQLIPIQVLSSQHIASVLNIHVKLNESHTIY